MYTQQDDGDILFTISLDSYEATVVIEAIRDAVMEATYNMITNKGLRDNCDIETAQRMLNAQVKLYTRTLMAYKHETDNHRTRMIDAWLATVELDEIWWDKINLTTNATTWEDIPHVKVPK